MTDKEGGGGGDGGDEDEIITTRVYNVSRIYNTGFLLTTVVMVVVVVMVMEAVKADGDNGEARYIYINTASPMTIGKEPLVTKGGREGVWCTGEVMSV